MPENVQQTSNMTANRGTRPIREAIARLEPNDAEFRLAIFNFMYSKVPITETQTSLRSILASDPILEAEYSSFLTHPTSTQEECEAARQNLGALMNIALIDFSPTAPSLEETEAFFASIKERRGEAKYQLYIHTFNMRLRNREAGIPTRPALMELLGDDAELLRNFERHWPKEIGEF